MGAQKVPTRAKRERFSPIQVYVSGETVGLWAQVQAHVAKMQAKHPKYSVSQFVTEAVREKLGL